MLSRSHITRIGLGIALAAVPATAFAHPGHGLAQGFSGGLSIRFKASITSLAGLCG